MTELMENTEIQDSEGWKIGVEYLDHYDEKWGPLSYVHDTDAGFDLRAAIDAPLFLGIGETRIVPCGVRFEIPSMNDGLFRTEIQVRSRSGLAAKQQLIVLNAPGTIDQGYRGEVMAIMYNAGNKVVSIEPGERIAQAVVALALRVELVGSIVNTNTDRGEAGFGSSGLK